MSIALTAVLEWTVIMMSRYIDAEPLEHRSPKLRALILEQPTADVEPVRHGHWEGKTYKCSLCGKWVDPLQGDADMNYCPNCGARMDGEEQEYE